MKNQKTHVHKYNLDYSLVGFRMLCKCGYYRAPTIKDWERYYFRKQREENKQLAAITNVIFKNMAVIKDFEVFAEGKKGIIKTKRETVAVIGELNLIKGKLMAKGMEIDGTDVSKEIEKGELPK